MPLLGNAEKAELEKLILDRLTEHYEAYGSGALLVCEMPRKTYSVASPMLAESLQRSCGGGGGASLTLPRAIPSAT